jgi:hypothetical protein
MSLYSMIFWVGFCVGYLFLYISIDILLTLRRKRISLLQIEYLRSLDIANIKKYLEFEEKRIRGHHANK